MSDSSMSSSGTVLLLIEESAAMDKQVVDGLKMKSESVATFVNAMLAQMQTQSGIEFGLVGYRTDVSGAPDVGSRWANNLAGNEFVTGNRLSGNELAIEKRMRKLPDGRSDEVSFPIWYKPATGGKAPRKAAFEYAARILNDQIAKTGADAMPPLVLHICTDAGSDGSPLDTARAIQGLKTNLGSALLFHIQLASGTSIPAASYLATRAHIQGLGRELFDAASVLPVPLLTALKEAKVLINPGARGVVCHARPVDLQKFLSLIKTYAGAGVAIGKLPPTSGAAAPPPLPTPQIQTRPIPRPAGPSTTPQASPVIAKPVQPAAPVRPAAPAPFSAPIKATPAPVAAPASVPQPMAPVMSEPEPAPLYSPVEEPALPNFAPEPPPETSPAPYHLTRPSGVPSKFAACRAFVLVIDRSVADPSSSDGQIAWTRVQDRSNEILAKLAKVAGSACDVAVISYGGDATGQADVRCQFEGPLAGRVFAGGEELATGALRTEEYEEQMSNGVGGLITLARKKQVYVELPPASSCSCRPAFEEVRRLLGEWIQASPLAVAPAIVLHVTRGIHQPDEVDFAAAAVRELSAGSEAAVLYHLVLTEKPMKSFAYPDKNGDFDEPEMAKLWEASSLLLGRDALKESKPFLSSDSRGLVINGKFDLLWPEPAV